MVHGGVARRLFGGFGPESAGVVRVSAEFSYHRPGRRDRLGGRETLTVYRGGCPMNTRTVGIMMGAGLVLTGCGTATAQAGHSAPPTLVTAQLVQGSNGISITIPASWTRHVRVEGAANNVIEGTQAGNITYTIQVPPLSTQKVGTTRTVFRGQYTLTKNLSHSASVLITVPNTPTNRTLAQRILDSVHSFTSAKVNL